MRRGPCEIGLVIVHKRLHGFSFLSISGTHRRSRASNVIAFIAFAAFARIV
jgi:hypothetical protein